MIYNSEEKLDAKMMHPRDQIYLVISRIYHRGLTTTSGGNVSIIDDNGDIWVTPSAVDKGSLTPHDIICVKKDGTIVGPHRPSSEFPFHKAIYEIRPDIRSIIHAHPPALVAFSIAHTIPDTNVLPQSKFVCGPIGYAEYALPGSTELGESIARVFREEFNGVIMENHGTVVGGTDLSDAFQRFEALEFSARTIINAKNIGEAVPLSDTDLDQYVSGLPNRLPEMKQVEHPSGELEKREEITSIIKRACRQGLMISSYGTVSCRWRDNDFLITPTDIPRWDMTRNDIVQIRNNEREPGKNPSRSVKLHQEIYRRHPEINSIILTQSPYLMAFGVSGEKFDVRTIPESWIFLQDVPTVPFGSQYRDNDPIPDLISKNTPAVIIQNDAFVVTGDALLQTFDRLEVAEFSANSLVTGKSVGDLNPIGGKEIDDLRKKFLE